MGYTDTKLLIVEALLGRPSGTEIAPEKHQAYALNLLEYIRSLELANQSTLIGIAVANTVPIQPDNSRVSYIAGIAKNQTVEFENFHDINGEKLLASPTDGEAAFAILLWNCQYWDIAIFPTSIVNKIENNSFYNLLLIRKTYSSKAAMDSDVVNPIGEDGFLMPIGSIVSVKGDSVPENNGFYSRTKTGWTLQPFGSLLLSPYEISQIIALTGTIGGGGDILTASNYNISAVGGILLSSHYNIQI